MHALRLAALFGAAVLSDLSVAQTRWPQKPVRLMVAAPAGGALDAVSRSIAEGLGARLGQRFIAEFRPGASGTVAADALLRAAPDGHTLLVAASGVATEVPHTLKVRFDPLRDLKPLAELGRSTLVLVGRHELAPADLTGLIREVKANPGRWSYASYGTGTLSHVSGLLLNRIAGLDLLHVAYNGSPPATADVLGARVPLMFDSVISAAPLVKARRLRAYAATGARRSRFLPDVPTFQELGYPQLGFSGWIGVFAPGGLAPELALRINAEFAREVASSAVSERLAQLHVDAPIPSLPRELERALRAEHLRNARMYAAFALRAE